jgi:hypothetical protein
MNLRQTREVAGLADADVERDHARGVRRHRCAGRGRREAQGRGSRRAQMAGGAGDAGSAGVVAGAAARHGGDQGGECDKPRF